MMEKLKKFVVLPAMVCVAAVMLYGFITGMQHYLVCSTFSTLVENQKFEKAVEYGFEQATNYLRPELKYGFGDKTNDCFVDLMLIAQADYVHKIAKKICLLDKEDKLTKADWDKNQLALTTISFCHELIVGLKTNYMATINCLKCISEKRKWSFNKNSLPPLYKIVTPKGELKFYEHNDTYFFIRSHAFMPPGKRRNL